MQRDLRKTLDACSCLFLSGDDAYGRKVIVLSACRLPAREDIDHEKLLMLVCATTTATTTTITTTSSTTTTIITTTNTTPTLIRWPV